MRKFKLTNPNFKGEVFFGYNIDGLIDSYKNDSEMSKAQLIIMLQMFPFTVQDIAKLIVGNACKVEELPLDLSFDAFWNVLPVGNKINRKRCIPLWEPLNDAHRELAIVRHPHYITFCQISGRFIADPENYLKKELYLTEWRNKR